MNAVKLLLAGIIGWAIGALGSEVIDQNLGWGWIVTIGLIALGELIWVERQPDNKKAKLLTVVADARIKGEAVRKDFSGMGYAAHGVYRQHRNTIIEWTVDTLGNRCP